jgi:hypothetical protein
MTQLEGGRRWVRSRCHVGDMNDNMYGKGEVGQMVARSW